MSRNIQQIIFIYKSNTKRQVLNAMLHQNILLWNRKQNADKT